MFFFKGAELTVPHFIFFPFELEKVERLWRVREKGRVDKRRLGLKHRARSLEEDCPEHGQSAREHQISR